MAQPGASIGSPHAYPQAQRNAVYRAIRERRDMRHFAGGTVAPEVLARLLAAAHLAPSVGFMQPWRFIRVTDAALRTQLHGCVEAERQRTADALGQRRDTFLRLKVEGLRDAAELIVVALAEGRDAHVFGRRTLPQMDLASVACAIENLWLAARAEGLGMGWVSMFDPEAVGAILGLPAGAQAVALLSLGPVHDFYEEPMLQRERWTQRAPLSSVVFDNVWDQPAAWLDGMEPVDSVHPVNPVHAVHAVDAVQAQDARAAAQAPAAHGPAHG
ncbi:MAG: 5,6-dimethylbenzimidazole synthase [Comamonadaceae bacterium]|nr:MAG: 5,6-dimethylbenzimidazole synthase [Comamonadaceae bacterium]